jgi:transcription antitermination factor NusG
MSGENHLHQSEQKWFAVRTRSKSEKVVINRLQEQGIEVYLPLLPVTRHYTRKVKHYQLPLISCYVFVKICRQDYLSVLKTDHVVDFVRFSKNLIAIPEREIDLLRRIVGETSAVQAEPLDLEKGDLVESDRRTINRFAGKTGRPEREEELPGRFKNNRLFSSDRNKGGISPEDPETGLENGASYIECLELIWNPVFWGLSPCDLSKAEPYPQSPCNTK